MAWNKRKSDRVVLARGLAANVIGSDGHWHRKCKILDISNGGAKLVVEGSLDELTLDDFWLIFSIDGKIRRRCALVRKSGGELGVRFLNL